MNVGEVIKRVKRTFGDDAGAQITDEDIINWVNDSLLQISMKNEGLLETTVATDVIQEQAEYDYPENLANLRSLSYKGRRLQSLSLAEFDEYIDGWDSPNGENLGTPEIFMIWNNTIRIFPKPDIGVAAGLKIYYIRQPESISTPADELPVPLQYHLSVVNYCLQQAYELDEDLEKSSFKKGQFDETLLELNDRNKVTQEYYPRITVLPEDQNFGEGYYGGLY